MEKARQSEKRHKSTKLMQKNHLHEVGDKFGYIF